MNSKIHYIVLIIAIAFVAGGFYFLNYKNTGESVDVPQTPSVPTAPPPPEEVVSSSQYKNTKYGFSFTLPESWEGYVIVSDQWEGYSLTNNGSSQEITEVGPMIYIRHPLWTEKNPRQDIPIMVFTLKQWSDLEADKFHIGAAPVGPGEIGRNATYVFALPARYNFSFLDGYEEVDSIIKSASFKAN